MSIPRTGSEMMQISTKNTVESIAIACLRSSSTTKYSHEIAEDESVTERESCTTGYTICCNPNIFGELRAQDAQLLIVDTIS
jgi:hypothetical protein